MPVHKYLIYKSFNMSSYKGVLFFCKDFRHLIMENFTEMSVGKSDVSTGIEGVVPADCQW
jgi:hypothetical protein